MKYRPFKPNFGATYDENFELMIDHFNGAIKDMVDEANELLDEMTVRLESN